MPFSRCSGDRCLKPSPDVQLIELGALFERAALDDAHWTKALLTTAELTGCSRGQLIGFDAGGVAFNWITEMDPGMFAELDAAGGNDPRRNSRLGVGLAAPTLRIIDEHDFTTAEDRALNPAYDAVLDRWDLTFLSGAVLLREDGRHVGLGLNRRARDGEPSAEQRRLFAEAARLARAAVRLRDRLGGEAAEAATGVLDGLGQAGFACDADGRVLSLSRAGAALLEAGIVRMVGGRLCASTRSPETLERALAEEPIAGRDLVLLNEVGEPVAVAEVHALSRVASRFGGAPLRLVLVRGGRHHRTESVLRAAEALFGFTAAEAAVSRALSAGLPPTQIAVALGVTPATVRTHVRALYVKCGVSSQLAFLAKLHTLQ